MQKKEHAIVMGASMAGLLATRVLATHFNRVTLIERDTLPDGPAPRRGVPQGVHAHGLLTSGRQILDRLFPGFTQEAVAAGALTGDIVRDCRWFFAGACLARPASNFVGLLASRQLLESIVRRRVLALPNVILLQCQVDGLDTNTARDRVTGVICNDRPLDADLVVDATGRGSRTPQWLNSLCYPAPAEESIEVGLRYTTRVFRRRPQDMNGDVAAIIPPTPEGKRGGVMLAQEGDSWIATMVGHFGQGAPEDLDGFLDYASSLPAPDIYDVIRHAEPVGGAHVMRFPASRRRRYENLTRFPEGYLVMGDSICSFNPIYGQGMSVAALEAEALDAALRNGEAAPRFFRRLAQIVDIPWSIAVGNDLRMPETVGPRTRMNTVINWYMAHLHRAAHHDAELSLAFHKVGNLLASPPSVMHPRLMLRVLAGSLRPPNRDQILDNEAPRRLPPRAAPVRTNPQAPEDPGRRTHGALRSGH